MKNRVFAAVLGVSLALGSFALTAAEPQGRTAHREVSIPATASAAWEILRQDGAELKRYLEKETLTPMDLHEIHMLSFLLIGGCCSSLALRVGADRERSGRDAPQQ
jgi:hypothetical protein